MRKILITTGGKEVGWSRWNENGIFRDYEGEANRLIESAKAYDIECIKYDENYLYGLPYYPEHKELMDKVSFGFTYKAIEMYETLKAVEYGDIVLLTDSNHKVMKDPNVIYEIADLNGCYIHNHIWEKPINKAFTRRDTFVNMGCDEEKYWDAEMMQINLLAFKKTDQNMLFIKDWFDYCLDPKVIIGENKHPNFPEYRAHRHDQSIYSILTIKYDFPYLKRGGENLWLELVIPEMPEMSLQNTKGNIHRREMDMEENP